MNLTIATLWTGDATLGHLRLIDQTLLPTQIVWLDIRSQEQAFEAIRSLRVRGAPAIGIAAAYGVILGVKQKNPWNAETWLAAVNSTAEYLATSRPTAVNLFWALDRMQKKAAQLVQDHASGEPSLFTTQLLEEAHAIRNEDAAMCRAIGRYGAELLKPMRGVLTHCNTGSLAVSEYGTALAAIYTAHENGQSLEVYADETRPLLQGARLTAWELQQAGIPVTVICDNMAAQVMREGRVQGAIVGADRIAANGDAANKIGTMNVAILCKHFGLPFYVAAPSSTFDLSLADGSGIPIEQRAASEVTHGFGRQTAPAGVAVYNPAFDVTPAELITAIICEKGIIQPVTRDAIAKLLMS